MIRPPYWLIGLLAVLLLIGCGDEPPPPAPPAPKPAPAPAPKPKVQPPAPQATETPTAPAATRPKVWPYLSQDHQVAVADDLLARNIVLIFDGSGSMKDVQCSDNLRKIDAAKKAVVEWSSTVPETANLGMVAFHARSRNLVTLEMTSGARDQFMRTVNGLQPGGKTPLTMALKQAFLMLEKQAQKQLGYGEYAVVIVTDGIANDPRSLTQLVDQVLRLTPINIFTIGFCISGQHSLNQAGRTFYRAADNPEQLRQGLRDTLAETEAFDATDFDQ